MTLPEPGGRDEGWGGVSPWVAGLRCACPRCGRGRLFQGFLTVALRCPVCGLDMAAQDSGDGPAVFLIFLLGAAVVPAALYVSLRVDWPLWLTGVVWGTVIIVATLGMLRPAKALVLALQYHTRAGGFGGRGGD